LIGAARTSITWTASAIALALVVLAPAAARSRRIAFADLPADLQKRFAARSLAADPFAAYLDTLERDTASRVADGEREHLIHYALQSSRFTSRPRIEPAESARRFVDSLPPADRRRLLDDGAFVPEVRWPAAERARVAAALAAATGRGADSRLAYFASLTDPAGQPLSADALFRDYVRVARFLYRKEFLSETATEVARLYQTRSHSSDTQVEASFAVYTGLGALHGLVPDERINRVLIVGPGLDLAPRTDLVDVVEPQSYQPFAVADAVLGLAIGREADLRVHAVDVNDRVVRFVQAIGGAPATLHVFSGIADTPEQPFSADYRLFVQSLGRSIGDTVKAPETLRTDRRYQHSVAVRPAVRRAITAEHLDIVTRRLVDDAGFDLVVITNVLPYFDDTQLALAFANMAAMLRPGGFLLHNESRAGVADVGAAVGLPVLHMRSLVVAGSGARALYDTIWLHRKQ